MKLEWIIKSLTLDKSLRMPQILLAALTLMVTGGASADDVLTFSAAASTRYDSNLFRRDALPPGLSRSDLVTQTTAGVLLDKKISLQRLMLDTRLNHSDYARNSQLNFSALDYVARWDWALTPSLTGKAVADRKKVQLSFRDLSSPQGTGAITQTRETQLVSADLKIAAGLFLLGGLNRIEQKNDVLFVEESSFTAEESEAGVRWMSLAGNSVTVRHRRGEGRNPGRGLNAVSFLDNRFDTRETTIQLAYLPDGFGGKSTWSISLGKIEREHQNFKNRDFDANQFGLDYTVKLSGAMSLLLAYDQKPISFQNAFNSYYISKTTTVEPSLQLSDKLTASIRYENRPRDYKGAVTPIESLRQDRGHLLQASLQWQPSSQIGVTGSVSRERRTSNFAGLDFNASMVSLTAKLSF